MRNALLSVAASATLIAVAQAQNGSFVTSGTGCVAANNLIYELFQTGVFDLDNTAHQYVQNGTGSYVVVPHVATIVPPSGVETSLNGDDTPVTSVPLSFTFEYPASLGATTEVFVGPNGHIFFEPETESRCCDGTVALADALIDAAPSIAGFNNDLNTSTTSATGNGRIWYEEQVVGGFTTLLVTWENAGEFGVTPPAADFNFQIQLIDDPAGDRVVVVYGTTTMTTDETFIGWSAGGGQVDMVGPIDFSVGLPVDGGSGASFPLTLDSSTMNPRIGDPVNWDITNLPASSSLGAILVGGPIGIPGGAPLDIIGWETCFLYTDGLIVTLPIALTPPTGSASVLLPPSAGLVGLTLESQAIVVAPGFTTSGGISSNLGTVTIGDNFGLTPGLVVQFEGTNTFTTVTRDPFFRVYNNSTIAGELITGMTIDFFNSPDAAVNGGTSIFDTDGLAGAITGSFDVGISNLIDPMNCTEPNTYRGTDLTVGLAYGAGDDPAECGAGLGATTGWIGTNVQAAGPATVQFLFSGFDNGEAFLFESDIDGGPIGSNGLNAALVTITTNVATYGPSMLTIIDSDTAAVIF